jgi:hypothetical protein
MTVVSTSVSMATAKPYVDLFAALLTPVIAIIAAYIAYQQYRANQLKLRHELYDRRLLLYNAVAEFLAHIFRDGKAGDPQLMTLLQKTRESYFLFGKDVSDYVTELYKKGVDLECNDTQLHHSNLPVEERTRLAHANGELRKWFGHQFDIAQKKFAAKLSLE